MLNRREKRVIQAFINCVRSGEYTLSYAIILLEDNARYGWLSEEAKDAFYEAVDPEPEPEPEELVEEEPEIQEA